MAHLLIDRLIEVAKSLHIPYVLIGGLALPAYNVARTTLDIDFCIYVESQKILDEFVSLLKQQGINTAQEPKITDFLFVIFTQDAGEEAEIWLTPCDRFKWDAEMVARIQRFAGDYYMLAPEDFIMTKLGRADRAQIDVDDVMQIILNNLKKLDWKYLRKRAKWAGVDRELDVDHTLPERVKPREAPRPNACPILLV